jgi:hypothetical protein
MRTRYVRCGGGAMLNFSGNSVENPENTHCVAPGFLDSRNDNEYLCGMFIKAVQKRKAGTNENPMYFRLCESYRDSSGKPFYVVYQITELLFCIINSVTQPIANYAFQRTVHNIPD